MRRRYSTQFYAERVARIKQIMPHACIGVDVIVGFPDETEQDFLLTRSFLQKLDVSYLHVFTYSERANTPAAIMEGKIDMGVRKSRNKQLRILSEKKRRFFYNQHLGELRKILIEDKIDEEFTSGYTDNYIKVLIPEGKFPPNTIQKVMLDNINIKGDVVSGQIEQINT